MNRTPAMIEAIQSGDAENLRAMLAGDSSLASQRDGSGVSAIMHALYRQRHDMVAMLLAAKPELDIFEAVSSGRLERVEEMLCLDPGLASNRSADGFTPLHFACFFRQEPAVLLLLRYGADAAAEADNPMRVTPLHSAVAARDLSLVHILLKHGAPPNARQQKGWTALHSAAQHGDKAMVELLLSYGAKPSANHDGMTPAALAEQNGHAEIVKIVYVGAR